MEGEAELSFFFAFRSGLRGGGGGFAHKFVVFEFVWGLLFRN